MFWLVCTILANQKLPSVRSFVLFYRRKMIQHLSQRSLRLVIANICSVCSPLSEGPIPAITQHFFSDRSAWRDHHGSLTKETNSARAFLWHVLRDHGYCQTQFRLAYQLGTWKKYWFPWLRHYTRLAYQFFCFLSDQMTAPLGIGVLSHWHCLQRLFMLCQ